MGGWGGQLQCEGWCYYGPGQQWRTPGHRAPQSLSSLCLGLGGGGGGGGGRGVGVRTRKKRPRLAERLAWPLRECERKEESVAGLKGEKDKCGRGGEGARDIKKFYVPMRMRRGPVPHCCGTLGADDSEAQIFAFLSFM